MLRTHKILLRKWKIYRGEPKPSKRKEKKKKQEKAKKKKGPNRKGAT